MLKSKWIVRKKDLIIKEKEIYILAEIFDNIYYPLKEEDKFKEIKIDIKRYIKEIYNYDKKDLINKIYEKFPNYFEVVKYYDGKYYLENLEDIKNIIYNLKRRY